ncbi:MAG: hypothetical protein GC162_13720 [Planctomycetes bacterium]|nr:hypothetical protein [Planctomycetota bacterium]
MLILMRLAAWLNTILAALIVMGLVDFALRLPAWLRFVIVVAGLIFAVRHVMTRILRSARVNPQLTALAMRLERLYPEAAGRLASAVAFATQSPAELDSPVARELAASTTESARGLLDAKQVNRLLDPVHLIRTTLIFMIVVGLSAGITIAAPNSVSTAIGRWANPFGDAAWPNRYHVESMTTQKVAPNNAPLRVAARVTKGDHDNLRTWVVYKFTHEGENADAIPWQRALMTRQTEATMAGQYLRPIEPQPTADHVTLYFEAGDDQSAPQTIQLIEPPNVHRAVVQIDPPDYASGQAALERHDLLSPPRPSVVLEALEGSRVRLQMVIDGSIQKLPSEADADQLKAWAASTFPGLIGDDETYEAMRLVYAPTWTDDASYEFELSWTLRKVTQFQFHLADAFGMRYEDQRVFRFEVRPDHPPRTTITDPAADESVLATATVPLMAEATDDVAIASMKLVARHGKEADKELASMTEPKSRAQVGVTLDLTPLGLKAGEELSIVSIAQDNYLLDGQRHDPVESTPRRLRLISEEELTRQLRTDLAELRQRAIRAQATQQRLIESEPSASTAQQQKDLVERIDAMAQTNKALQDRMSMNRLKDENLNRTASDAQKMLSDAKSSAGKATEAIERAGRDAQNADPKAAEQLKDARAQQDKTEKELAELVDLLDQGRDAYELKQKLVKLQQEQQQLADQVRKMLPQTLGKTADQLTDEQKAALNQAAEDQAKLAEQARQLTQRMRSTAAAISRQSEKPEDQANAEAMKQAADTATQQKLDEKMDKASEQAKQNQLSQSQQQQASASDTIDQMLKDLGRAEQIRQEILQRKLLELVEAIRKLREQQQAQLDRLKAAEVLADLDAPMLTLRRNTLAVAETARATDRSAGPVADLLELAAKSQGGAVEALRAKSPSKPTVEQAETDALAKLDEALKLAQKLADEANKKMSEEERAKLAKEYQAALAEQKAIMEATTPLSVVAEADRDRRFRAETMNLGNRQADLRVTLKNLQTKLGNTIVYNSVHEQIDNWAGDASTKLRRSEADARVVIDQRMIVMSLEALIEALKPSKPDNEFADQQGDGGGGGGGGKQPLIPPIAEVKLLRQRQVQIHEMTRMIDQPPAPLPDADRKLMVQDLGQQQSNLAQTGERLIRAMQNRNAPPGGPEPQQ